MSRRETPNVDKTRDARRALAAIEVKGFLIMRKKSGGHRRPQLLTSSIAAAFVLVIFSTNAHAAPDEETVAMLRIVWIAICAALVLFMQPGFAFLESGLARAKNSVNVIMKNFSDFAFGALGFWAVGYGIMFGANNSGWIGSATFLPDFQDPYATVNLLYQTMFAATAATIVSGAVAERIRYIPYVFGALLVTMVVYPIFGSWAWGGSGDQLGWLKELGFVDAAGATVVHSVGGWCALGAVLVLGPRIGRFSRKGEAREIPGHNLPMFAFGGFVLWFGWFGFNGGAVADDFSDLGRILLNTNLSAACGVLGALAYMYLARGPILMTHTVNGALGGLVAVTAGCKTMDPAFAMIVGLAAGVLVVSASRFLAQAKIDDVVGAIPVHGVCGAWGTLAAGLFFAGDMFNVDRILTQCVGILAAFVWAVPASWAVFKVIDKVIGLRVTSQHEQRGLDFAEHFEIGYSDFMGVETHGGKDN